MVNRTSNSYYHRNYRVRPVVTNTPMPMRASSRECGIVHDHLYTYSYDFYCIGGVSTLTWLFWTTLMKANELETNVSVDWNLMIYTSIIIADGKTTIRPAFAIWVSCSHQQHVHRHYSHNCNHLSQDNKVKFDLLRAFNGCCSLSQSSVMPHRPCWRQTGTLSEIRRLVPPLPSPSSDGPNSFLCQPLLYDQLMQKLFQTGTHFLLPFVHLSSEFISLFSLVCPPPPPPLALRPLPPLFNLAYHPASINSWFPLLLIHTWGLTTAILLHLGLFTFLPQREEVVIISGWSKTLLGKMDDSGWVAVWQSLLFNSGLHHIY